MFWASRAVVRMQLELESFSNGVEWVPPPAQCRCVRGGSLKAGSVGGEPGGCGLVCVSAAV